MLGAMKHRIALAVLLLPAACTGSPDPAPELPVRPDVAVSRAPFAEVHVSWKQRLDQAYVWLEHRGPYGEVGRSVQALLAEVERQGIEPAGPVFGLFDDDPAAVAPENLRARVCVPVQGGQRIHAPLQYAVLPGKPVVYALVGGAYAQVPGSWAGLERYLSERGWVTDGPWRQIFLNPGEAASPDELLTEVQVPWTVGG